TLQDEVPLLVALAGRDAAHDADGGGDLDREVFARAGDRFVYVDGERCRVERGARGVPHQPDDRRAAAKGAALVAPGESSPALVRDVLERRLQELGDPLDRRRAFDLAELGEA